jgi:hypothetical protein
MNKPNLSVAPKAHRRPAWSPPQIFLGTTAVLALTGGSYWALQPRPSDGLLPRVTQVLPENTVWFAGLAIDQQPKLLAIGNPASRQLLQQRWSDLQKQLLPPSWQWETDIVPWLDREAYLAYLSVNNQQVPLLVLPVRGSMKIAEVVSQLSRKVPLTQEVEGSANTVIAKTPNGQYLAQVDNLLLISPQRGAIEQASQARYSTKNLANRIEYREARQEIQVADPLLRIYVNVPLTTTNAQKNRLRQGLAMNGTLQGNLLAWQGVAWGGAKKVAPTSGSSLAQRLPTTTMLTAIGSDLANFWKTYQPLATNNALAPINPEKLVANLKSSTGLDFQSDILSWSKGEFAIALIPQSIKSPAIAPTSGSLLILAASKDRGATDRVLSNLDKTMASRYQYELKNQKINDTDVIQWLTPVAGAQGTRGWLGDNVAFLNLGAATMEQFLPNPGARLSDRSSFQQVTQSALKSYDGRFYLDFKGMQQAGNLSLANFPAETRDLWSGVQELGMTMANGVDRDRFDFALTLEQVPEPSPSPSATIKP